jgi:hypothetical protein
MEIRNGFIFSIFKYCDRWCETCAFTSHCRLFADLARIEAAHDPAMAAVVQAPRLPQDEPPSSPGWLATVIEKLSALGEAPVTAEEDAASEPDMCATHRAIHERAGAYFEWVFRWLATRTDSRDDPTDPVSVIAWFASLNASKIDRALSGLAEFDGDREYPPDHEGSAKVALIGIDRSQAAWQQLVAAGRVAEHVGRTCVDELEWLKTQLEQAIPYARAFIRPGFDEPDAVAGLESALSRLAP